MKGMNQSTDTLVGRYDCFSAGEQRSPFQKFFSNTLNLSAATEDIRSPKAMSSVPFSGGSVKSRSSLRGSQTS